MASVSGRYYGDGNEWAYKRGWGTPISTFNPAMRNYIPKYSQITSASMSITIKSSISAKGDLKFALMDNDIDSNTLIEDFGACVGSSDVTKTSTKLYNHLFKNGTRAGELNSSRVGLGFIVKATVYREWTWRDCTFVINYNRPTVTINTSKNIDGGTVTATATHEVQVTDYTTSITATPKTGYRFVKWNIGGTEYTTSTVSVTISQNNISAFSTTKNATAYFEPISYTITTAVNPTGSGTVTGGGTYEYGSTKTLTATPNTGYEFVNWNDGVTTASRSITVTGTSTYTANFRQSSKIYIGTSRASAVYIGTTKAKAVYIGTTKIL